MSAVHVGRYAEEQLDSEEWEIRVYIYVRGGGGRGMEPG